MKNLYFLILILILIIAAKVNSSTNLVQQSTVELALPDTFAAPNRYVDFPLQITGIAGFDIISALITVQFDSSRLKGIDVISQGTLTENWQTPAVNNSGTGFSFALAGSLPLAGDGILVFLRFFTNPLANENDSCDLKFVEVMLNEGDPTTINLDGHFRIRGSQIAGSIKYHGTGIPVPNTQLQLSGYQELNRLADTNGNYAFNSLHYGNYVLRPQKSGDQGRSVTPFDAALILQHVVGNSKLTPYQFIAADVSGDSTISAFDASLIMRYSVRLEKKFPVMVDSLDCWNFVPTGYPINDSSWVAHPDSLVYQPLDQDQFNQNFIGMIYGDVSQNWISPIVRSLEVEHAAIAGTLEFGDFHTLQNGIIEATIYLKHPSSILSAEIELEFNIDQFNLIHVFTTELSKEFLISYNSRNGRLKIALAGAKPIIDSGAFVKMQFRLKNENEINFNNDLKLVQAWLNDQQIQINFYTNIIQNLTFPRRLELSPNYPNPFNQETTFKVSIPEMLDNEISLVIYNLRGQAVRTLLEGKVAPGNYTVRWDGMDDWSNLVTSGEYFCILKSAREIVKQKFILLK